MSMPELQTLRAFRLPPGKRSPGKDDTGGKGASARSDFYPTRVEVSNDLRRWFGANAARHSSAARRGRAARIQPRIQARCFPNALAWVQHSIRAWSSVLAQRSPRSCAPSVCNLAYDDLSVSRAEMKVEFSSEIPPRSAGPRPTGKEPTWRHLHDRKNSPLRLVQTFYLIRKSSLFYPANFL